MIKIEKIVPKGETYELTLDEGGEKTRITVHQDVLMRHHLFRKKTLTKETRRAIEKENATAMLMKKAVDLLALRDYSLSAMRKKLLAHGNAEAVSETLDTLQTLGYLDDTRMLERLVEDMLEYSLKGPHAIREKAIREGFEASDADAALAHVDETTQKERLTRFIEKAHGRYQKDPARRRTVKLIRLAVQNGYDAELASSAVKRHVAESKDEAMEERLLEKRVDTLKGKYDLDDYKSRSRLIQKLMREGFEYESIIDRLK